MNELLVVAVCVCLALLSVVFGRLDSTEHALQGTRETLSTQAVQLELAQKDIRQLETDMDRIAPHTIPSQSVSP